MNILLKEIQRSVFIVRMFILGCNLVQPIYKYQLGSHKYVKVNALIYKAPKYAQHTIGQHAKGPLLFRL